MNADLITRTRQLLAAATPGPWATGAVWGNYRHVHTDASIEETPDHDCAELAKTLKCNPKARADAALIAAAPVLLAALCDKLELATSALRAWNTAGGDAGLDAIADYLEAHLVIGPGAYMHAETIVGILDERDSVLIETIVALGLDEEVAS